MDKCLSTACDMYVFCVAEKTFSNSAKWWYLVCQVRKQAKGRNHNDHSQPLRLIKIRFLYVSFRMLTAKATFMDFEGISKSRSYHFLSGFKTSGTSFISFENPLGFVALCNLKAQI